MRLAGILSWAILGELLWLVGNVLRLVGRGLMHASIYCQKTALEVEGGR